MPLPRLLVIWKVPPSELMREAMFESPMPQSIIAWGLKPRPSSVYSSESAPPPCESDRLMDLQPECLSELLMSSQMTR